MTPEYITIMASNGTIRTVAVRDVRVRFTNVALIQISNSCFKLTWELIKFFRPACIPKYDALYVIFHFHGYYL